MLGRKNTLFKGTLQVLGTYADTASSFPGSIKGLHDLSNPLIYLSFISILYHNQAPTRILSTLTDHFVSVLVSTPSYPHLQ